MEQLHNQDFKPIEFDRFEKADIMLYTVTTKVDKVRMQTDALKELDTSELSSYQIYITYAIS